MEVNFIARSHSISCDNFWAFRARVGIIKVGIMYSTSALKAQVDWR